uniref:Uncharacterized protein n=1 Tax=Oryza punctata TaxID=4537 RepID=A0A0E0L384_ORYPU
MPEWCGRIRQDWVATGSHPPLQRQWLPPLPPSAYHRFLPCHYRWEKREEREMVGERGRKKEGNQPTIGLLVL